MMIRPLLFRLPVQTPKRQPPHIMMPSLWCRTRMRKERRKLIPTTTFIRWPARLLATKPRRISMTQKGTWPKLLRKTASRPSTPTTALTSLSKRHRKTERPTMSITEPTKTAAQKEIWNCLPLWKRVIPEQNHLPMIRPSPVLKRLLILTTTDWCWKP